MRRTQKACFISSLSLVALVCVVLLLCNGNKRLKRDEEVKAVAAAEAYMTSELYTITNKESRATSPTGDKRDYVSVGSYYWPNPDTEDGYPYVYRDGEFNKESITLYSDCTTFKEMTTAVTVLGAAYECTKDIKYVDRIEDIIRVFFIDETTKMNPHMRFAKITPSGPSLTDEGKEFGILEALSIQNMLAAVEVVSESKAWDDSTTKGLTAWVEQYVEWLRTSPQGQGEGRIKKNNHGTHFDSQFLSLLLYLGQVDQAKEYIEQCTIPRLEFQVAEDGSQPLELARTKSWNYCMMNLKGWMHLADFAQRAGVDLWNYEKDGQIYIKSMVDWYIPYLKLEKEWKWKQIINGDLNGVKPLFERAAEIYGDKSYLEVVSNLQPLPKTIID